MNCTEKGICIDLTGGTVDLLLTIGRNNRIVISFPYSIVGYSFIAKIIDPNTFVEIMSWTIVEDEANNRIVLSLDKDDSEGLTERLKWYVEQSSPSIPDTVIIKGNIRAIQTTDLTV